MRTVHHTYRRKAKFPKELLTESSDQSSFIEPLIYGAKPKLSSIEPLVYGAKHKPKKGFSEKPLENIHETTIATSVLEPTLGIKMASLSPKSIKTMKTAVSSVSTPRSKNPVAAASLKSAPGADVLKTAVSTVSTPRSKNPVSAALLKSAPGADVLKTAVSAVSTPRSKNPVSAASLKSAPGADVLKTAVSAVSTLRSKNPVAAASLKSAPGADVLKTASTVSAEIIKQELGLSSGITLQKVKRTSIPPTALVSMVPGSSPGTSLTQLPKLSYHGPKIHAAYVPSSLTQTYGSISLTPIKRAVQEPTIVKLTSKSPSLVNVEPNAMKSFKIVPIPNLETVKCKKEIPTLLPLKKIH